MIEIPIDIDPQSLVYRIMSVREQIAREFLTDLDVVRIANDQSECATRIIIVTFATNNLRSHIFSITS